MTPVAKLFLDSFTEFFNSLFAFIPQLLVALIIWYAGKHLIGWGVYGLKRVKVEGAKPVNKIIDSLAFILMPLGKVILFLIVLDYLGIGRTVIQSLLSGITFAIAIALGIAFGRALEPDAKTLVDQIKKELNK